MNAVTINSKANHQPSKYSMVIINTLFKHLSECEFIAASNVLRLMCKSDEFSFLPFKSLSILSEICLSQNWDEISKVFIDKEFIGESGYFLWFAPFSIRREGKTFSELTGIFGKVINLRQPSEFDISKQLNKFKKNDDVPGEIISVEGILTFGFTGTESGEAFLIPNGWKFKDSKFGPALNDLNQQRNRFLKFGLHNIKKIFDVNTAQFLLSWVSETKEAYETQSREYQYHEFGHFSGISLNEKIANKAFLTPWHAAVEEWRSDGVAFHLAIKTMGEREAARMIAANICLRFGVDSQRLGGIELDSDVNASLILFDRLLESGTLSVTNELQLTFNLENIEDLLDRVYPSITSALELTRMESSLKNSKGIWNLYGGIKVSPISRNLFEIFVRKPCTNHFNQLR